MKRGVLGLVVGVCLMYMRGVYALTDPSVKEQQLGIDLYLELDELTWQPPGWYRPVSLDAAPEDIDYWMNEVLPYAEDRNKDVYLVAPQLGFIMPSVAIPEGSYDFTKMMAGQDLNINAYLQGGAIEYVGSVDPGYRGLRTEFAHSNYYVSDPGRYKTAFSNLMALDVDDQVWYFVRQADGTYTLYKYLITASYPTHPADTVALDRDGNGADLVWYGCYYGLAGRRIVQATYMGEPLGVEVVEQVASASDPFAGIDGYLRQRIDGALTKLAGANIQQKKYHIIRIFQALERAQARTADSYKLLIADYVQTELAVLFPG